MYAKCSSFYELCIRLAIFIINLENIKLKKTWNFEESLFFLPKVCTFTQTEN